jgi:hypothetical protein
MLFREIGLIDICSMNRIKHIYRTCVESAEFSYVTIGVIGLPLCLKSDVHTFLKSYESPKYSRRQ